MEREEGKVDRGVGEPKMPRGRQGTRRVAEYTGGPLEGCQLCVSDHYADP